MIDRDNNTLLSEPLLEAKNVRLLRARRSLVTDWNWSAQPAQWWAVIGPNGAGKSTLLATLAGLRPPAAGTVFLNGQPLATWPRRALATLRAFLPQHPLLPDEVTVLEAVLIGRYPHLGRWLWPDRTDFAIVHEALAAVDLADYADRPVATLSGGERQRVALATVLTQQPKIFLLDEPLNHLDLRHQQTILTVLAERCRKGAIVITVVHDLYWVGRYATGVILVYGDGRIDAGPAREWFAAQPLSELFGITLTECPSGSYFVPAPEKS